MLSAAYKGNSFNISFFFDTIIFATFAPFSIGAETGPSYSKVTFRCLISFLLIVT